jgi:hypothetical protein
VTSFIRQLSAELRKALHPVLAVFVGLAFGSAVTNASNSLKSASFQVPITVINSRADDTLLNHHCLTDLSDRSQRCGTDRANLRLSNEFRRGGRLLGGAAQGIQSSWAGTAAYVAGLFGTGVGWILVFALCALIVAGEWQFGTIGSTLLSERRLVRLVGAKALAVWLIAATSFALTVIGVRLAIALTPGYLPSTRVPNINGLSDHQLQHFIGSPLGDRLTATAGRFPASDQWTSSSFALRRVFGCLLILLVVAACAAAIAAVVRRALPVLAVGIVIPVVLSAGPLAGFGQRSPLAAASALLDLAVTPPQIRDTLLWPSPGRMKSLYDLPSAAPDLAAVCSGAVIIIALVLATAVVVTSRRDLIDGQNA